jgi:hypothetical protein
MTNSLRDYFKDARLTLPPLPEPLASKLEDYPGKVWGTREPTQALYRLAWWVDEVQNSWPDDYLVIGQSGHGAGSTALHYYLVIGHLAVLLQLPWGGINDDRDFVGSALDAARELVGAPPPKTEVVVVVSPFSGSWWKAGDDGHRGSDGVAIMEAATDWLRAHPGG